MAVFDIHVSLQAPWDNTNGVDVNGLYYNYYNSNLNRLISNVVDTQGNVLPGVQIEILDLGSQETIESLADPNINNGGIWTIDYLKSGYRIDGEGRGSPKVIIRFDGLEPGVYEIETQGLERNPDAGNPMASVVIDDIKKCSYQILRDGNSCTITLDHFRGGNIKNVSMEYDRSLSHDVTITAIRVSKIAEQSIGDTFITFPFQPNVTSEWAAALLDKQYLFDEIPQVDANGDLVAGQPAPTTRAFTDWNTTNYMRDDGKAFVEFDFGKNAVIKKIFWARPSWNKLVQVESYDIGTGTWVTLFSNISGGTDWNQFDVPTANQIMSKIRLVFDGPYGCSGFALWGSAQDGLGFDFREPVIQDIIPQPTFNDFIGACSFLDVPIDIESVVKKVRQYFNFSWIVDDSIESAETRTQDLTWHDINFRFPLYSLGNLDSDLQARKDEGVSVILDLMKSSTIMKSAWDYSQNPPVYDNEWKAHDDGATDFTDPNSYRVYASAAFQLAARYGNNTGISTALLKLTDPANAAVGLGLIDAMEFWNEQDMTWVGREGYWRPEEYGAFLSACIDGNNGQMKDDSGNVVFGALSADPNLKVQSGGMAGENPDYIEKMLQHMASIRGQTVDQVRALLSAFDFHFYSNDGGGQFGNRNIGVMPESDVFKRQKDITVYRNRYFQTTKYYNGEFGYDTFWSESGGHSTQVAPKIINRSAEETQAAWLLRANLELYKTGVDAVKMYMIRDVSDSGSLYYSSGLTKSKATYERKPSWWLYSAFLNALGNHKAIWFNDWEAKATPFNYPDHVKEVKTQSVVNPAELGHVLYIGEPYEAKYADQAEALAAATGLWAGDIVIVESDIDSTGGGYYMRLNSYDNPSTFAEAYELYTGKTKQHTVTLDSSITRCRLIEWNNGSEIGKNTQLRIVNNQVTINVTDMPVIILGDDQPLTIPVGVSNVFIKRIGNTDVDVIWEENDLYGENVVIERSTDQGTWTLVATLSMGALSYTDTGLSEDTIYYYRIAVTNEAGSSPWSTSIAVRTGLSSVFVTRSFGVDFRHTAASDDKPVAVGWNNYQGRDFGTMQLFDTNGNVSNIFVALVTDGWNATRTPGTPSSAYFPVEVYTWYYYHTSPDGNGGQVSITGLDPAKLYNIKVTTCELWAKMAQRTEISVSYVGKSVVYDGQHNTQEVALLPAVRPDASGNLTLTIKEVDGDRNMTAFMIEELGSGQRYRTTAFRNDLLKHILTNQPIPGIGDATGLSGSAANGSLYISLHTADPGEAGGQSTNEATYAGYVRVAIPRIPGSWAIGGGSAMTENDIRFPKCASGNETITHFAVGTDASGVGRLLYRGPLQTITISAQTIPVIKAADIMINED